MEHIVIKLSEVDDYTCGCGNSSAGDEFYACDSYGKVIESAAESGWNGAYVCAICGRIHKVEQ